jgi:hypothetical protein
MRLGDRILSLLARCFPLRKILASYRRMKVVVAALGQEQPPLANYDLNFVDTAGPRGGSRSTFRLKHFGPHSTPKLNGIMSALEPAQRVYVVIFGSVALSVTSVGASDWFAAPRRAAPAIRRGRKQSASQLIRDYIVANLGPKRPMTAGCRDDILFTVYVVAHRGRLPTGGEAVLP